MNQLGETKKAFDENAQAINGLNNSINALRKADRAGGQALQNAVKDGFRNLENQTKKFLRELNEHEKRKPNPRNAVAVRKYKEQADRLDARKKVLKAELDALSKAEKDPRAAKEWTRKKVQEYELAQQKLNANQAKLKGLLQGQAKNFAPLFQGMVDRCQKYAKQGASSAELKSTCGFLFDGNNPYYKSLKGMGIDPERYSGFRVDANGKVTLPFPPGPGKPIFGPKSPLEPGFETGPGVPPVGPGRPVYPPDESKDEE